jgi:phosphoribulokinase
MISFVEKVERARRHLLLGVAGDSASGKTTLTQALRRILGEQWVSAFSMDDYHCMDRRTRREKGITALNPVSTDLHRLAGDLRALKRGEEIQKPIYDHRTGTLAGPEPFAPRPVMIVEGLHPYATPELLSLLDFTVYIDPSRKVKRAWKLKRDVGERGHTEAEVLHAIRVREPDFKRFVELQMIDADMIVHIGRSSYGELGSGERELMRVSVIQRRPTRPFKKLDLTIDLADMLLSAHRDFMLEFASDSYYGHEVAIINIDGELERDVIERLEYRIAEFTGTLPGFQLERQTFYNAMRVAQLLLCWRFLERSDALLTELLDQEQREPS